MLKDLSEKERRTHRQIEIFLSYSRNNRFLNERNMRDWAKNKRATHAVDVDRSYANEAAGKARVLGTK